DADSQAPDDVRSRKSESSPGKETAMRRPPCIVILWLGLGLLRASLCPPLVSGGEKDPTRVLEPGKLPADSRLGKPRDLNDKDFFLKVPASKEVWEARRKEVREQVLVALGLWPMPEKTPLNPVIHGKIDRDD